MTETRPQLLLLPGLLNDAELWRDQISGLADVARCEVADLTRGETIREMAEQALAGAEPTFALAKGTIPSAGACASWTVIAI